MARERSVLDALATYAAGRDARARAAAARLLAGSERLAPAVLERRAIERVAAIAAHAREHVPWYAGLPPCPEDDAGARAWLASLPVLSRADVRDHAAALVSRRPPRDHAASRTTRSSGSTGRHVEVQVDAVADAVTRALAMRFHAWHARDLRAKAAAIRAFERGARAPHGRHERAWNDDEASGPLALLDVHTPVREQLDWLAREAPTYLATYPNNLLALLREMERAGAPVRSIREVGTFGEVLAPEARDEARRVLGARVVDAYSAVETGWLALECPVSGRYHVQAESVLLEVLRADGSPAEVGEPGRVVVTPLHAFVMPLLRYELGDLAIRGEPCACGRGLPVLTEILGRSHDLLRLPSGDVLWPRYGSPRIGGMFPLRQFRLVQTTLRDLVLEIVPIRALSPDEERALVRFVSGTLGHPFSLTVKTVDELPRSPGGKYRDFVCAIDDASHISQ